MKRLTALLVLVGFLFGSTVAVADCGGCPKPNDNRPEIATNV